MIFQNNKNLLVPIHEIGCEFLCVVAMFCHYVQDTISIGAINNIWIELVARKLISNTFGMDTAPSYQAVIHELSKLSCLGDIRGDQVGNCKSGFINFYAWWKIPTYTYIIRRLISSDGGEHSILCEKHGRIIYDPNPFARAQDSYQDCYMWIGTKLDWDARIKIEME